MFHNAYPYSLQSEDKKKKSSVFGKKKIEDSEDEKSEDDKDEEEDEEEEKDSEDEESEEDKRESPYCEKRSNNSVFLKLICNFPMLQLSWH